MLYIYYSETTEHGGTKMTYETYGNKTIGLKMHKAFKSILRGFFHKPVFIQLTEQLSLETYDLHEEEC